MRLDFCLDFDPRSRRNVRSGSTSINLASNAAKISTIVDRGEAGDLFLLRLRHRFFQFHADSRYRPLFAAYANPGGGKSFFLDQLALCKGRLPGSTVYPELDEVLQQAIFINITFNGQQPQTNPTSAAAGLALRLLHS